MKHGIFLFLCCVLIFNTIFAQSSIVKIQIKHAIGDSKTICTDSIYRLNQHDSIKITTLRYYISGIELLLNNQSIWIETNSFHLIDISDSSSSFFALKLPQNIQYNQIKFNLGIDSITSNAGALGGDLDPSKGMYWSWQSGYINLKLEVKSNLCKTNNQLFQLHLGGYLYPYLAMQQIVLNTVEQMPICIVFDLEKWIQKIPLDIQHHIMSPSNNSVLISKAAAQAFRICTP